MSINLYGNMNLMTSALNGFSARSSAISQNLANINTPGYKRETVSFENELKNIMTSKNATVGLSKTNYKHIGPDKDLNGFKPTIVKEEGYSTRKDKSNVNPDIEMIELAKTNIMYNTLTDQISRRFSKLQSVIAEGAK